MIIFPIKKCPACGTSEFLRMQNYTTRVTDVYDSEGNLISTTDPSNNGFYKPLKTWYCASCNKRLFTEQEVIHV